MSQHTQPPWFLGTKEVDPGEDGYNGRVYAAPADEDIAACVGHGMDPEPYEVARCGDEADAALIVRCVNSHGELLALLERMAAVACVSEVNACVGDAKLLLAKLKGGA